MLTRQNARAWWLALLLVSASTTACNRLGAASGEDKAASQRERKLPFHSETSGEQTAGADPGRTDLSAEASDGLPFRSRPRILPSGTLITVRLEHPLDSAEVHAGDAFTAVVAEPVTIDGDMLVDRGTTVAGAIESAQESSAQRSTGFLRLTLSAITIDGKQLPLQTSSLFAKGRPPEHPASNETGLSRVRLPQGRRLTFRLTSSAPLDDQNSIANRQFSTPSTE